MKQRRLGRISRSARWTASTVGVVAAATLGTVLALGSPAGAASTGSISGNVAIINQGTFATGGCYAYLYDTNGGQVGSTIGVQPGPWSSGPIGPGTYFVDFNCAYAGGRTPDIIYNNEEPGVGAQLQYADPVTVTAGNDTSGINATFCGTGVPATGGPPTTGQISGRVTGTSGGLPGVSVEGLLQPSGTSAYAAHTSPHGFYRMCPATTDDQGNPLAYWVRFTYGKSVAYYNGATNTNSAQTVGAFQDGVDANFASAGIGGGGGLTPQVRAGPKHSIIVKFTVSQAGNASARAHFLASLTHAAIATPAKAKTVSFGHAAVTVSKAGSVTLTIKPSAKARRALTLHHRIRVTVTVVFTPTGGAPVKSVKTVVVKS